MMRKIFLVTALLCLTAQRMPAPITVPPEDQQTSNTTGQDSGTRKPDKKAPNNASAPKESRISFVGEWSGATVESYSTSNDTATLQQFWTVTNDERSVTGRWIFQGVKQGPVQAKCQRNGDTLTWQAINNIKGNTVRVRSKLTLKNGHSANFRYDGLCTAGPEKGQSIVGTGLLTR